MCGSGRAAGVSGVGVDGLGRRCRSLWMMV